MRLAIIIPILFLLAYLYPYIPGRDLPWCAIKIGTGIDCPGCGMVRSISLLVHGHLRDSFLMHPLGVVVAGWLLFRWGVAVAAKFTLPTFGRASSAATFGRASSAATIIFIVALFAVWIARLII